MNGRLAIIATTLAATVVLAGCATFSEDGGMDTVSALTRERAGHPVSMRRTQADDDAAEARVAELLKAPLSAEAAVELALLNNRGLQASLNRLGIAEADLVAAGRLRNPVVGFGRLAGSGLVEIERSIVFDLLGLLSMPAARAAEQERFEAGRLAAADDAVGLAADTRLAWIDAVAADELARYFAQVKEAADASNELARRMVQAGHFSALEQMREQAFYADATAGLARSRQQAVAARERLTRLLGLSGERLDFRLPERLPDLPGTPAEPADAERTAIAMRLDLQMARRNLEATARRLGLAKVTRYVDGFEIGYQNASETGRSRQDGYTIAFPLPLFDFGAARQVRAEATYRQALHRTADAAVRARSEVRESYSAYRTAWDLARHYREEVVPLRKRISEENLRRYNGMLIGVFELLADAREQVRAVSDAVGALRDFWRADANLKTALTGRSPAAASSSVAAIESRPAAAH